MTAEKNMQSSSNSVNSHNSSKKIYSNDPLVDKDGFTKTSTVFPWIEQNKDLNVETIQSMGQKTVTMKVRNLCI
jgi:hypothetical protein